MEEQRLFMPQGLKAEREWREGFGRRELVQAVYGSIVVVILAIVLYVLVGKAIVGVGTILFGEASVLALVIRSQVTNISIFSSILFVIRFFREQQHYTYKQMEEEKGAAE